MYESCDAGTSHKSDANARDQFQAVRRMKMPYKKGADKHIASVRKMIFSGTDFARFVGFHTNIGFRISFVVEHQADTPEGC